MNLKALILGLIIAIIVWVGYVAYAAYTLQPRISAQWGYVDEKTTEVWIDAELGKPLLVPAAINNLTISFVGTPVAREERFEYSATGTKARIALAVDNENLVHALIKYIENGQRGTVSVTLSGKLLGLIPLNTELNEEVSEDVLGYLNFTAESKNIAGGLAKSPALVGTSFDWAGEENGKAVLIAHMKLYNPNGFPIPVGNLSFDAYANDIKIGYGKTARGTVIPARGYATVDVKTYIIEDSLPKVWATHIKNGEVSKVRADLFIDISLMSRNYRIKMASYEETVQTDIMGELNSMLNAGLG
jgi:LEA14-like dessication related protein